MKNVTTELAKRSETRKKSITRRIMACTMSAAMAASMTATYAMATTAASSKYKNNTTISGADSIINLLLTVTKYAGIGLAVFGAYELAMSFLQNQPEAKTKGIIMLIAGVIMVGAPTILKNVGIV